MVRFEAGMEEDEGDKRSKFCINDNVDVLIEILKMLDGPSLGVAACVCSLWRACTRNDSLWETLCFRHVPRPPDAVRAVVLALGGYRSLYMACVRPVLMNRLLLGKPSDDDVARRVWSRHEVELSLSLFCVDYYERVLLADGEGGGRHGGDSPASSSSSLLFLCKAVNV
ncbi:PREDICTED: F-box protein SNE-like [Ipomoea nil]|uniref:F-box protein SNE-like n=1 Tax=Ipomoea nil TaxID=35883 RepID=UPI00090165F6|nr:PREDICTED: F-box protein SNE-like [Ipomoea nil]